VLALNPDDFHKWRQKGARYIPMVLSGLLGNALRTTVAAARADNV
jgi:hypothetical protein